MILFVLYLKNEIIPHFNQMKVTKRLIKDFKALEEHGPKEHVYVKDISESIGMPPFSEVRMMIVGPNGAHKNCLFFFRIIFKKKYPLNAPMIKFINPYAIRCHPNLYMYDPNISDDTITNGKVCLSILGTTDIGGAVGWSPMMSLEAITQSMLSVLDDDPLRKIPGYETMPYEKGRPFANAVRWECLRRSVELWTQPLPEKYACWQEEVNRLYIIKRDELIDQITDLSGEYDGQKIEHCEYNRSLIGVEYNYASLLDAVTQ
jgi:ubiquitin-protein ligase